MSILSSELIRQADQFLDGEEQVKRFTALGKKFFTDAFRSDAEGRISAQVRSLQQIAVSARRLADVEDFVKNQMGRAGKGAESWRKVGQEILDQLQLLRTKAQELGNDDAQRLALRLHFVRGWMRTVVGAYLYAKAEKEIKSEVEHGA